MTNTSRTEVPLKHEEQWVTFNPIDETDECIKIVDLIRMFMFDLNAPARKYFWMGAICMSVRKMFCQ